MILLEMFSYAFIQRALIVGVLISLCAALLGVSLVLRKNSMIGDGLSHVAFGAFAIATVLGLTPLYFAIPVVIFASSLILWLSKSKKSNGDAVIALVSASSLAIGTIAISVTKGVNIDLNSYLFGSILAISWNDVIWSVILSFIVIALYSSLNHRIFAITFDEDFARSIGIKTNFYDFVFAIICSLVVVIGMRLLGSLLISSLIIFPTMIARILSKSFTKLTILAPIIAIFNFIIGMMCSYLFALPTGATVVIINLVSFCLVYLIGLLKG